LIIRFIMIYWPEKDKIDMHYITKYQQVK
jgi:hypothetical protein